VRCRFLLLVFVAIAVTAFVLAMPAGATVYGPRKTGFTVTQGCWPPTFKNRLKPWEGWASCTEGPFAASTSWTTNGARVISATVSPVHANPPWWLNVNVVKYGVTRVQPGEMSSYVWYRMKFDSGIDWIPGTRGVGDFINSFIGLIGNDNRVITNVYANGTCTVQIIRRATLLWVKDPWTLTTSLSCTKHDVIDNYK
jgi:hypothetical protein